MGISKDITGQRFGRLVAVQPTSMRSGYSIIWEFRCDCGNIKNINPANVKAGRTQSCGCLGKELSAERKFVDLTGKRFGRMIVQKRTDMKKNNRTDVIWECLCDCGKLTYAETSALNAGQKKSCGCLLKDNRYNVKHYKDLTGKRFGRLVAVKYVGPIVYNGKKNALWECLCDCGNTVNIAACNIDKKTDAYRTKSCGCLLKEMHDKNNEISYFYGGTHRFYISKNKPSKNNTSGVKGVHFIKRCQKWQALIQFKRKTYYLGRYSTIEAAAKARAKAEEIHFEKFLDWYNENFKNKNKTIENKN